MIRGISMRGIRGGGEEETCGTYRLAFESNQKILIKISIIKIIL